MNELFAKIQEWFDKAINKFKTKEIKEFLQKNYYEVLKRITAIAYHETYLGTRGVGERYLLGYGATDSGTISKFAGAENQIYYVSRLLYDYYNKYKKFPESQEDWEAFRRLYTYEEGASKNAIYSTDTKWAEKVFKSYKYISEKMQASQTTQYNLSDTTSSTYKFPTISQKPSSETSISIVPEEYSKTEFEKNLDKILNFSSNILLEMSNTPKTKEEAYQKITSKEPWYAGFLRFFGIDVESFKEGIKSSAWSIIIFIIAIALLIFSLR